MNCFYKLPLPAQIFICLLLIAAVGIMIISIELSFHGVRGYEQSKKRCVNGYKNVRKLLTKQSQL
jgi:hypothetical protein